MAPGTPCVGLKERLKAAFRWADGDKSIADPSGWWREPVLLDELAEGLSRLHTDAEPTVVAGVQSRGLLLGPVVALRLGVGFVESRKNVHPEEIGEALYRQAAPPDYAKRDLVLTLRRWVVRPRDRVLLIDDWIETGAQASAARSLVEQADAEWIGVAAVVDALSGPTRHQLNVRALLRERELPW